jgi:hypothetical protein
MLSCQLEALSYRECTGVFIVYFRAFSAVDIRQLRVLHFSPGPCRFCLLHDQLAVLEVRTNNIFLIHFF